MSANSYSRYFGVSINIFYPIMGYYIENKVDDKMISGKNLVLLISLSFVSILASVLMTHYVCVSTGNWSEYSAQQFFNSLIALPTITTYICVKKFILSYNISKKLGTIITTIGGTTFGIMLIENIIRTKLEIIYHFSSPYFGSFIASLIWVTTTVIIDSITVLILKKVPIIKTLI